MNYPHPTDMPTPHLLSVLKKMESAWLYHRHRSALGLESPMDHIVEMFPGYLGLASERDSRIFDPLVDTALYNFEEDFSDELEELTT